MVPAYAKDYTSTDYCGNVIYESGVLARILTGEGYITLSNDSVIYHYFLTDHLGNNRVVMKQNGVVEQVNEYYPFGGLQGKNSNDGVQPNKFGGKELDRMYGLDLYDFVARPYDPGWGGFITMDPLCEKYPWVSPYAYCMNNPMNAIDPDGRQVIPVPLPLPPPPVYYPSRQATPANYPTAQDLVRSINQEVNKMATMLKLDVAIMSTTTMIFLNNCNLAINPGYDHQRKRDRRSKEELDQNQANVAKSIDTNITGNMPNGDPAPKRDPNDGRKGTKTAIVITGVAAGISSGLEITNPEPGNDAVEAHTEKIRQIPSSTTDENKNLWETLKNWLFN